MGGRMDGRDFGCGAGLERKTPPPGYVCHRCKVTPLVLYLDRASFQKKIEGIPSTHSVADLPPEIYCPLCREVMKDAVLTSKCCFRSLCDKFDCLSYDTMGQGKRQLYTLRLSSYLLVQVVLHWNMEQCRSSDHSEECPSELRDDVASIIFAAPRCSDIPDLLQVGNLFTAKYGKEFIAAASELRHHTSVNRVLRLKVLNDIAQKYNVEWDSSKTEAEFSKQPDGSSREAEAILAVAHATTQRIALVSNALKKHGRLETRTRYTMEEIDEPRDSYSYPRIRVECNKIDDQLHVF